MTTTSGMHPPGAREPALGAFEHRLPWVFDQQLGSRRITISMPEKGWTAVPAAETESPGAPN